MAEEHRCFLAIDIDPHLVQKIEEVQKEFKQTHNDVKYVEKENLHFTLKFFGNMTKNKIVSIKEAINTVLTKIKSSSIDNNHDANNQAKTELAIEGIGTFPNKNYMKVLWIGTKNNSFLTNLQKELDLEFEKLGFKKKKTLKHT